VLQSVLGFLRGALTTYQEPALITLIPSPQSKTPVSYGAGFGCNDCPKASGISSIEGAETSSAVSREPSFIHGPTPAFFDSHHWTIVNWS